MLLSRRDWRTNTRRHLLPVLSSMRERRVAVVAVVCVARADSSFREQVMSHTRAVLVESYSRSLFAFACVYSLVVATGGLEQAPPLLTCALFREGARFLKNQK